MSRRFGQLMDEGPPNSARLKVLGKPAARTDVPAKAQYFRHCPTDLAPAFGKNAAPDFSLACSRCSFRCHAQNCPAHLSGGCACAFRHRGNRWVLFQRLQPLGCGNDPIAEHAWNRVGYGVLTVQSEQVPATRNLQVETELIELVKKPIDLLRQRWRALFRNEPPPAFGPDLLRRSIAQKLQEDAYGGLDPATTRLLNQLIAQSGKNNGRLVLPRRIKAGAVLVREFKGKTHRVTVTESGFAFAGKPYDNLSKIARLITGTRWNGPRFFGLRPDKDQPS
jgi:hypothetical protein